MYINLENLLERLQKSGFIKYFIISIGLYCIALFSLISADVYYIDDWGRSMYGNDWNEFSRYAATILFSIVSCFKKFTDISPLPQVFGIVFVSLGAMIILWCVRKRFDILGIIATLPLGLSPFYLQNFSYKFDSITMSFSLLCAIVPFLWWRKTFIFALSSIICLVVMYCSYQASNGVYIVLSIYIAMMMYFIEHNSAKNTLIFLLTAAISFIIASLVYKYVFVIAINNDIHIIGDIRAQRYVLDKTYEFSMLYDGIFINTLKYIVSIFMDIKDMPSALLMVLLLIAFPFSFSVASSRNKLIAFVCAIIFIVLGICLSYGTYLILYRPLFEPRAFIGFGAFLCVLCISCISFYGHTKILKYFNNIVVVALLYSLIVFANAYGNALKSQDDYMRFRSEFVLRDLVDIIPKDSKAGIVFIGSIGYAPSTQHFIDTYGEIGKKLIREMMINAPLLHLKVPYDVFYSHFLCQNKYNDLATKQILQNSYHTILNNGYCYFVVLEPMTLENRQI